MSTLIADFANPAHAHAIVELIDMYSRDEFGSSSELAADVRQRLIPGLIAAHAVCVLASAEEEFVGVALCLPGFSSFRAKPLLNIHDIAVKPGYRGRGVGRALLAAVEEEARRRGCCKITLEVRADNVPAQEVYRRVGYQSTSPETFFWSRPLE